MDTVYAAKYDYIEKTYVVEISGVKYTATVKFFDRKPNASDDDERYEMDLDSIQLTSVVGNVVYVRNDIHPVASGRFCADAGSYSYLCNDVEREFSKNQLEDEEYIMDFLPKFIEYDGKEYDAGYYKFLYYIGNDELIENDFWNIIKEYANLPEDYTFKFQSSSYYISSSKLEYETGLFEGVNLNDWPLSTYIEKANELKELLDDIKDLNVCTEDDLEKMRAFRNIDILGSEEIDILLSSTCYNILFGSGKGKGNLKEKILEGNNYMGKLGTLVYEDRDKMGCLFYETYYLNGLLVFSGEFIQEDFSDVVKCNHLGDKTTEIFQLGFNIIKFGGIIIGTLLGIVDVFKAVVSKEETGKKQFVVLLKRIIAIIALILTPIIIEIIFELINTIGIDDPICGIR